MAAMKPGVATPVCFSHFKYGQPLAVDASPFPNWTGIVADGEPHVLDFHEFLVVSSGRADVVLEDRRVRITGPTVLFTPPRTIRRVIVDDPLDLQLVVFSDRALRGSAWTSALTSTPAGTIRVMDAAHVQQLGGIARSMSAELREPRTDSGLMLDALLSQFLITLNRARRVDHPVTPALVERFERALEANFRRHHDVGSYADALGVTADHLSSMVRAHHGVSAKAIIDRCVYAEASRLLAGTRLPIHAIAEAIGFDEPAHFTRFVIRISGHSPSRLRQSRK